MNSDNNLTMDKLQAAMVQWAALLAPPWEMMLGEARLQPSQWVKDGDFLVADVAADPVLPLPDCDRRKMVLANQVTIDLGLAALREAWPPIARLSLDKQQNHLAAFYAWKANSQGMPL